jgi:hypothetical protein
VRNQFRFEVDFRKHRFHVKAFRISELSSYVVCGGRTSPIGPHIFNMQTIWHWSAGDDKSIPALKMYILWNMVDSIPYLVPTQFQESIFPLEHVQKYRLRGVFNFRSIKEVSPWRETERLEGTGHTNWKAKDDNKGFYAMLTQAHVKYSETLKDFVL